MSWNYRIIDHGDHLALHEVHYDEAGNPKAFTERAVEFVADPEEGAAGITGGLEAALANARGEPVLKVEDLPGGKPEPVKLDAFHAHEAVDRAAMLAGLFEGWVQQHPYVEADPALSSMAAHAMKAMSDFHQAVGQKALA